ncbi:MAG: hypothetical protein HY344_03450 [Candidatus Levybacteria bacterium]|nr:hypothetical protein [Candidatus Levybacteria bacterium]
MSTKGLESRERIPTQMFTGVVSRVMFEGGPENVFLDDAYKNPDGTYRMDKAIRRLRNGDSLVIHDPKSQDKFSYVWRGTVNLRKVDRHLPGIPDYRQVGVRTLIWNKWFQEPGYPATLVTPVYTDGPKGSSGYPDIPVPHGQGSFPKSAGK